MYFKIYIKPNSKTELFHCHGFIGKNIFLLIIRTDHIVLTEYLGPSTTNWAYEGKLSSAVLLFHLLAAVSPQSEEKSFKTWAGTEIILIIIMTPLSALFPFLLSLRAFKNEQTKKL